MQPFGMHCHDAGCFVHTYPFFRSKRRLLTMFFYATRWLYVHLYMLVYMIMHKSCLLVYHPCFNIMRLWTSDPNLHLSLADTTFCLLSCLFTLYSYVCSHPICYACHCYLAYSFCALLLLFVHLSLSITRLLVSFLCLCMYTHGARAQFPRRKQKGCGCKLANMSRATVFSRFRVQLFPLAMYSFKPLPSTSLSPLDGLYQVYNTLYHSSLFLEYGDPCLFSCTYILGHALGMQAFTFLLCMLALCMMHVYIYLLALFRCDCHDLCHLRLEMPNFHCKSKVTSRRIFAVKIWYFARMPQESIYWDHIHSKAKPQSPPPPSNKKNACEVLKANAKIMFLLLISKN